MRMFYLGNGDVCYYVRNAPSGYHAVTVRFSDNVRLTISIIVSVGIRLGSLTLSPHRAGIVCVST